MANHTIIVGVALSGLCLAHALIARGGSVTVFASAIRARASVDGDID
jgi:hypothetical protein